MALDPNIAMQVRGPQFESPQNALMQIMQMQAAQRQNELGGIQLQQARQGMADDNALRVYLGNSANNLDTPEGQAGLMRVAPTKAGGILKDRLDKRKTEVETGKLSAETAGIQAKNAHEAVTRALQTIPAQYDPAAIQQWYASGLKTGVPGLTMQSAQQQMAAVPTDPQGYAQWRSKQQMLGLDLAKQLELNMPKLQAVGLGGTTQITDMNPLTRGTAPMAMRHTATPGEVMTDARARDRLTFDKQQAAGAVTYQQDSEGNFVALPTRVQPGGVVKAQPVAAPGAGLLPLQGKGAGMTEDQGKATGWLVQANNAFKNMTDAMRSTPGAAKPGFPDMVAGIPSMGIGGAIGNTMRGADRQKFIQASSSLSEALLRAATGAGVNKDEAAQKINELTPVFGESEETTAQKMAAIPLYIESLKVRAGPGAKKAAAIGGGASPAQIDPNDPLGLRGK